MLIARSPDRLCGRRSRGCGRWTIDEAVDRDHPGHRVRRRQFAPAELRLEQIIPDCYTTPVDIENGRNLAELGSFCRKMGREARQGEIGLVVGDEYFTIRDFGEE